MTTTTTHAKGKSKKADPAFVDFLDTAGHELRVPITAMKSQLQLLQRRLRKEEGRDADLSDLGRIAFQVERLNQSLEVLLEAAHVEQGRLYLMPSTNDLVAIVQRSVSVYSSASRAHTLTLHAPETPIVASIDRQRIELVLGILLANALKYSPVGDIEVCVSVEDGSARVEVSDHGIGIKKEERSRVFQAYAHGSNVENSGLGLGLYVAREIVSQHGGRIGVRANRKDGSVFWFTLPLRTLKSSD
ncbi:MAG TPA: HAMP domain-containing sensor histidine kinase [Ktedonobacterales bacterium]|jgi:signal transduction histidine kinase|nr:HAMP domain-containing sensor histidine kinase [Ktedonobacterales bacterium]